MAVFNNLSVFYQHLGLLTSAEKLQQHLSTLKVADTAYTYL